MNLLVLILSSLISGTYFHVAFYVSILIYLLVFFSLNSCSTVSEFTLLERRQYVVDNEIFEVPEGIETEEELYDYLTELHEKDACELRLAYRDKMKSLEHELQRKMESMVQSWWYYWGCKKSASGKLDVIETEMRYQRHKYEGRRRKLRKNQNVFLRKLWSNIGEFRMAYLIRHLRATTTCHSVHQMGLRTPSCYLDVNGEYISLPDYLQCPHDIRVYFNMIYSPREIKIREPFRRPSNFSEAKLKAMQMEIMLDLLDAEQKFVEAEAWDCIRDRDEWAAKEKIFNKLCKKLEESEKEIVGSALYQRKHLVIVDYELLKETKAGAEPRGVREKAIVTGYDFDEDPKDYINSWAEDSNSRSAEPKDEEDREQPSEVE
jgi:hypothetical protein